MIISNDDTIKSLIIPCTCVNILEIGYARFSSCVFALWKSDRDWTVPSSFEIMNQGDSQRKSTSDVMTQMAIRL
jgi:hypothetical protein